MQDFEVTVEMADGSRRVVSVKAADVSVVEGYVMRTTQGAVRVVQVQHRV
jgi:hypothetical protein